MRSLRAFTPVLVCLTLGACHVGPQIDKMRLPYSPNGADVLVKVNASAREKKREYRGELLETTADGLLVGLSADSPDGTRMAFVPWRIVYSAVATEAEEIKTRVRATGQSHETAVEEFRLISRYPQGLSPDLRDALLASFGQTTVLTIE